MFNSGQQPRIPSFNKCLWSAYTGPSTFIRCQRLRHLEGRIESFFFFFLPLIMCIKPGDRRLCCRNNPKLSVADHTPSVFHFYSTHSSWTVNVSALPALCSQFDIAAFVAERKYSLHGSSIFCLQTTRVVSAHA